MPRYKCEECKKIAWITVRGEIEEFRKCIYCGEQSMWLA